MCDNQIIGKISNILLTCKMEKIMTHIENEKETLTALIEKVKEQSARSRDVIAPTNKLQLLTKNSDGSNEADPDQGK